MRIGIDARMAGETGIGRYVTRLIEELAAMRPSAHEFVLFTRDATTRRFAETGFRTVPAPVRWYTLAEQLRLPAIVRREKLDLFHAPHWNVPVALGVPFVMTIHDLILLRHPSRRATIGGPLWYAVKSAGHRLVLTRALAASRAIIAVSAATADDVRKFAPQASAKIVTIPLGGPELARRASQELSAGGQAAAPVGRYVLYVGNAYPHKDLQTLLAAISRVRREPDFADLRLIWIGQDDHFSRQVRASAAWRALADAAEYRGPVSDTELAAAYRGAQALVTASQAEGFGLTPLEALAFGTPVVVTDIPAHREVLGDAARFVPPGDAERFAAVVAALLRDPSARARAAAVGPAAARRFSWRHMAEQTLAVYDAARPSMHVKTSFEN